jgi:hypothetical protein
MKYILPVLLIAVTLTGSCQQVFHDKDAQVRKTGDFHSIEVSGAIELQLSPGNENAVAVSASKENINAIRTEVKNGVLKIWNEQKSWFGNNSHARVYVSAKSLDEIGVSGASEVKINGVLTCSSLAVRMSGASDMKGEIKASSLQIKLSGASDAKLSGSAEELKVEASGASHLKGYEFMAENGQVHASGASDVELTANKAISAEASGASSVHYKGTGKEGEIRSSGASSVSKRG